MYRIGQGYDLHQLVPDTPLLIGGVLIKSPVGSLAHSDGDVLLHALMDALLGALSLGDIGEHFPPNDNRYKGASSKTLLKTVLDLVKKQGFRIENVDSTIFLETPKLSSYKKAIQQEISTQINIPTTQVSVKAKTMEKLGSIGKGEAVAASVSVLLRCLK